MGKYYKHYNYYDLKDSETVGEFSRLTILDNFKTFQQRKNNTCAPCCAIMMLNYLGDYRFTDKDEMRVAKMMKTRAYPYGTDLKNVVDFFHQMSDDEHKYTCISSIEYKRDKIGLCFSTFKRFKNFILDNLKSGYPILVENVDYGGQYKIIIGYDCVSENAEEDMLIFVDPSDLNDGLNDGYTTFPAERFFYMWFDDHCLSEEYRRQPFVILKKDRD